MRKFLSLFAAFLFLGAAQMWAENLTKTEGFETKAVSTNYQSTVTVSEAESDCGIGWSIYYGTVSTNDKISGNNSAQMRYYYNKDDRGYVQSTTPVEGLSNVAFKARVSNVSMKLTVSYSEDGLAWTALATNIAFETAGAQGVKTLNYDIPSGGKYIKFEVAEGSTQPSSSNIKLIIDDVVFTYAEQGGEDPQPTTQDLYLKLSSDWADWPAKYAIYYFNDTENGWSEFMTEVEGEDNTYTATIPVGYSKVIFVRLDGAATEANWDNKWSQTVNLTIPEGKNHFTVTSGGTGSECDGTWSKYPVIPTYYVKGTFDEWGDGHEMTEGTYTFEDLAADTYEIKVVDDANNWYGFEVLDQTKSSANIYEGSDGNIKFTLAEAGNVTVAYANSKITVTGTFVAPSTKFTVTVPEGTEKTYIAGNFNNWTPAEMTLKAGEEDVFELTVEGVESDTVAYKYLAGADWKFEEVIENNRSYNAADEVSAWKAVPQAYKFAKVTAAPINWTGHYIIAWADHKPHSAIKVGSSSKDDFVAADDALVFTDGDTISIMEGMDFAVNIRFGASEGAYTLQLPDGKYIYLPNANGVCSKDEATDMYLAVSPSTTQTGIQIGDKADMSNRVIYNNSTNYRSYTNKYETTGYILPTLYRLVDEAFDCQDGPYAILVNGKDVENTVAGEEFDGYKQYVAYLSLSKGDSIQLINTSCGATWLPAIEEGGMSAHFKKGVNAATIDTTGCFDLYIKMKSGDDKIYIGAGICAGDTVRYYVTGIDENWDEKAIASMKDTLVLSLKAGDYRFKVLPDGSWDGAIKGYDELTQKDKAGLKADNDRNICFTLKEAGDVTIVYNDTVFTVTGKFYVRVPEYKDLYLVPGVWAQEDAKIAAWIYTKKEGHEMEDQWTAFFAPKAEGNDTLTAKIDAEADSIVFVRFNATAEAPSWEEKDDFRWNSIAGDTIDYVGLTYTITDWYAGTWKKYEPAKFYITGDSALVVNASLDKEKAWAPDAIKVTEDSYTFENLVAGDYKLKVTDGAWSSEETPRMNLGFSDLTQEDKAGLTTDNDNNICFTLKEAGNVVVTYKVEEEAVTFTVTGKFYVRVPEYKDLYFVPGVWAEADAKIAAWIYTRKEGAEMEDQWTAFFAPKAEGNDTLTAKIDAEADSIVFVRFNATAEAPSWEEKDDFRWNSIAGDTIDYAGLTYTITDWAAGTWKKYEPILYYIAGEGEGLDWTDKIAAKQDTTVLNLKAGDYKLKVVAGENWLGYDKLTKVAEGLKDLDGDDHNIGFTLNEDAAVTIVYNDTVFTVTGKFYIAPIKYYLAGTMTNWKADSIELVALEDKADSLGVTVALEADSLYAFKVVRVQGTDTTWYGLNETAAMTYGNSEGWWIYKSEGEVNQANVGLQTTKEGEYSFTLKVAEDHLEVSVAIPVPTPTAAVTGSMNNWEGQIPFELAEDEKTATLFVDNMKSGEYDFRMIIGGQERSNGWWFKRDVLGAAGITGNDANAMKLIADVDGDYTITWFFANDSIHFEFPAPAMFYVTGDSALVKDAAGLEKKDEWKAKAIKAEQDTLVLSLKADQEYKLKLIEDGNWEGGKVYGYDALTQEDKAGLSADNDNNIVFKLNEDGDVKVVYFWEEDTEIDEWKMTFKLIGDFYVEPEIPHTYTVVGPSLPNKWDQTSTASDMTLVEGVYTYVLADVELKAGAHEYKIVEDHAWDVAFPQNGNASFSVEKDGIYDVTFTLNKETKAYTAVPELKQEIIIAPTAVLMGLAEVEPWTVGESMEVAEGFKTASITKHFVPSKAEGDTLKFKVVINDAWRSNAYLYHRDFVGAAGITMNTDGDMKVVVDVEGDYTFTWTFENDSIGITFPEKPELVMDDGYYIIGLNGWNVADLTEGDMFWSTGIETGEFSLDVTLAAGNQFKVVRVEEDEIIAWYPEGDGNNYFVDADHAGATTVYFRPNYNGNDDWFAGCIYVLPTSTVDIDNLDVNAPAVKILRDGQILIIKGNKTFNIQGQLVK